MESSLHFINIDAKNIRCKADRNAINTHALSQYHRKKRHTRVKTFQNDLSLRTVPFASNSIPNFSAKGSNDDQEILPHDVDNALALQSYRDSTVSPCTIVQKGNSDPFGTFAVTINPTVNNLMVFSRDVLLPALHNKEHSSGVSIYSSSAWSDAVVALHDECRALGALSRTATTLSKLTGELAMTRLAHDYKNRASELLRHHLAQASTADRPQTYKSIFWLLAAENADENWSAATIHARMLGKLLGDDPMISSKVDGRFLQACLYMDIQRASMSLTRPSFEVEEWVPKHLHDTFDDITVIKPLLGGPRSEEINLGIEDKTLSSVFQEWNVLYKIYKMVLTQRNTQITDADWIIHWLSTRVLMVQGRLLHHHADLTSLIRRAALQGDTFSEPLRNAYTQVSTTLAALYVIRCGGGNDAVPIVTSRSSAAIFDSRPTILSQLRKILRVCERHSAHNSSTSQYGKLLLWIFWSGASIEHSVKAGDTDWQYCTLRFRERAKLMGLHLWDDVENILREFLYHDDFRPHGSEWFQEDHEK